MAFHSASFHWLIFIFALITALLLQILSNIANDYGDTKHGADNEARVGPKRMTQSGNISKEGMKRGMYVFILLSLVTGISLVLLSIANIGVLASIIMLGLGLIAITAAIAYTATDTPYGYSGWGDISVFIFFGILGVGGSYYLQIGKFDLLSLLPAAGFGLLSAGVLNVNNIRDIETDRLAKKKTIVVRIGLENGKTYHWILLLFGVALFSIYGYLNYHSMINYLFLLPALLFFKNGIGISKSKNAMEVMPYLKQLVISILIFTVSFIISLVI